MKHAPASRVLAVAAAACAVALLGASCKTTSETWRRQEIGTEWERRTKAKATAAMEQINAAARGDDSEGYMQNEFDEKTADTKKSLFGKKKYADGSTFRTKEFSGADEYKYGDYHFLKQQNYKAKTARDQDQRFAESGTEAREEKRRFFWQRKRARTKKFADSDKRVPANLERKTQGDLERLETRDVNIVEDPAKEAGATMTIDDVRTLLNGQ